MVQVQSKREKVRKSSTWRSPTKKHRIVSNTVSNERRTVVIERDKFDIGDLNVISAFGSDLHMHIIKKKVQVKSNF